MRGHSDGREEVGGVTDGGVRVEFDRHVSVDEAERALDPAVGDGTPATAPATVPEPGDWDRDERTIGISPKVIEPAVAGIVAGVALLIVGALTGDETLKTIGGTLIAGAIGGGALGYRAQPGDTAPDEPA